MSVGNKFLAISAVVALIAATLMIANSRGPGESLPPVFDHDLNRHPLYQTYAFGEDSRVLDIGTQPLFFPTGLISEVLKRDLIFRDSLRKIGVEVRFHPFLKGRDVNHFMSEGKLEAGIGGDAPTLWAIATLKAVAPVVVQRGFLSIVADRPMLIGDLKGKRIGYARGSNAHYALLAALEHRELKMDDVTLVPMDITQMTFALDRQIVDAFSAWEPEAAEALNSHPDFEIIHQHIGTGFLYFADTLERTHPHVLQHTVAAVIRAVYWLRADTENLNHAVDWLRAISFELSGEPLSLTNRQLATLAHQDLIGLFSLPELPAAALEPNGSLQREYEFLVELGNISGGVLWEQVRDGFRPDIMATVLKSPDQFRVDEFSYNLNELESN